MSPPKPQNRQRRRHLVSAMIFLIGAASGYGTTFLTKEAEFRFHFNQLFYHADKANLLCKGLASATIFPDREISVAKGGENVIGVKAYAGASTDKMHVDLRVEDGFISILSQSALEVGFREGDKLQIVHNKGSEIVAIWTSLPEVSVFAFDRTSGRAVWTKNGSKLLGLSGQTLYLECG